MDFLRRLKIKLKTGIKMHLFDLSNIFVVFTDDINNFCYLLIIFISLFIEVLS